MGGDRDAFAIALLRFALVLIFLWFGWMKFLAFEAEGVARIATDHFAFFWLYPLFGVAGSSAVIGVIEIATGLLLALGQWKAWTSALGGSMGMITFILTLSFMFTAGPMSPEGYNFPALGSAGQFLIKDVVLLMASMLIARDGWRQWQGGKA